MKWNTEYEWCELTNERSTGRIMIRLPRSKKPGRLFSLRLKITPAQCRETSHTETKHRSKGRTAVETAERVTWSCWSSIQGIRSFSATGDHKRYRWSNSVLPSYFTILNLRNEKHKGSVEGIITSFCRSESNGETLKEKINWQKYVTLLTMEDGSSRFLSALRAFKKFKAFIETFIWLKINPCLTLNWLVCFGMCLFNSYNSTIRFLY